MFQGILNLVSLKYTQSLPLHSTQLNTSVIEFCNLKSSDNMAWILALQKSSIHGYNWKTQFVEVSALILRKPPHCCPK